MADFESIIKNHIVEDGSIPADAIVKLTKAISTVVGNEFVEKKRYKDKLEEIETLKADKQTAEDSATTAGKWKDKYEAIKGEFETYKSDQTAKETKAAKEKAVKAYYESKNITGDNLAIAMRGSGAEIDGVELDGDKIKDTAALDALVSGAFAKLVSTTTTKGAQTATPPAGGGTGKMTKAQIFEIKDTAERQRAIAQNLDVFQAE